PHLPLLSFPTRRSSDLFALMAIPPTRLALAGLAHSWRDATVAEVSSVLQGWRTHRLELLQSAYHALHDLVVGSWYADPAQWPGRSEEHTSELQSRENLV